MKKETPERKGEEFEVRELEDTALEEVAGGGGVDISCEDNGTCPNNGCVDGCSPNVGCKTELQ